MKTHDQLVKALMDRPGVKAEVDRFEREEAILLDTLLKARHEAGLTQADVTQRMHGHTGTCCCPAGAFAGHRKTFAINRHRSQVHQGLRQKARLAGHLKSAHCSQFASNFQ